MKKKTVAALLAMSMVLSAAACGTSSSDSESAAEESASAEKSKAKDSGIALVSVDDVSDYITIGEYKGLTLQRVSDIVSDEAVQAEIEYALEDTMEEVPDGEAQEGDTLRINYTGTVNGEALANGSEEDYDLVLGYGVLGDDFDNALMGTKAGDTKDISVTYADDYYDSDVAGKTVDYTVTVQTVSRAPELTDEWVAANTNYQTIDEYKAGLQTTLEEDAKSSADEQLYYDAWNTVLENSTLKEYPEKDVENAKTEYEDMMEDALEEEGISLEEFLDSQDMTEDDYNTECEAYAQAKVEQNLIVQGIMDAEGLTLDDDVTEELKDDMALQYGYESYEELSEAWSETELTESLALLRVERFIVDNAEISEVTETEDALVANEAVSDDGTDDTIPEEDLTEEDASEEDTPEDIAEEDTQEEPAAEDAAEEEPSE